MVGCVQKEDSGLIQKHLPHRRSCLRKEPAKEAHHSQTMNSTTITNVMDIATSVIS